MIKKKCILKDCNNMIRYDGLCFNCQRRQKEKEICEMNSEQLLEELTYITNNVGEDIISDHLLPIMCNFDSNVDDCLRAVYKENIFYPGIIYKNAPKDIRDSAIQLLEKDDGASALNANQLLLLLAFIGDEVVQERFSYWSKNPPDWRKKLYVDPLVYAEEAGWTMNENGERENLYFQTAYKIIHGDTHTEKSLRLAQFTNEVCESCGSSLCSVLELNLSDERLRFLKLNGKLKNIICLSCIPWASPAFCKFEENGDAKVYKTLYSDSFTIDPETANKISNNTFVLDTAMVNPYHSAHDSLPSTFCQIGGLPAWIDDAIYANCPDCGKKMIYFAQIDSEDISSPGRLYFEICSDCKIIATIYQQT